ncbi:MAG: Hsp70 family protein [Acidimicrobiales bacterium]|nr:Hsp70 family protein [Acidimicrobiales bacterium]
MSRSDADPKDRSDALSYVLGIDLGTTFTAAAVLRDGRVEIATLGNRAATIPSLVFLRDDQTMLVGDAAERRGITEPQRLAREFKRRIGDSAPIMVGQAPYSAERLAAALLREVVAAVEEREGQPPDRVAVSHPANWGPFKVDLLRHAVELAGLRGAVLLTEPVAAAMHYASTERVEPGEVVAVYDLGGGTFDAAVLQKTDVGFVHLGEPEGIERLGGIDFDEAVLAHVRQALAGKVEELDRDDPRARSALVRLRQECVAAKEALSFDTDVTISVLLPNIQTELRMTRAELEPMIRPAIAETIDAFHRALEAAHVTADELAAVLLVGGSSRIPLVTEMVSDAVGRPVAFDAHPKHAVALGAALAAAAAEQETGLLPAVAAPPPPSKPSATSDTEPTPEPVGGSGSFRSARGIGRGAAAMIVAVVALGLVLLGPDLVSGGGSPTTTETTETSETTDTTDPPGPTCDTTSGRCAFIGEVVVEGDRYVAGYETVGFEPLIFVDGTQGSADDHHVHFFFDTTSPDNAGSNGNPPGQWELWDRPKGGGELRFDAFAVSDRGEAGQLCVVVADASHAVDPDSGNCVPLPEA